MKKEQRKGKPQAEPSALAHLDASKITSSSLPQESRVWDTVFVGADQFALPLVDILTKVTTYMSGIRRAGIDDCEAEDRHLFCHQFGGYERLSNERDGRSLANWGLLYPVLSFFSPSTRLF